MAQLVYFSSRSGNTAKFVARLGLDALRIPIDANDPMPLPDQPYVLISPTYADGEGRGAVPKQVIKFLNDEHNRSLIRGVITGGNTNFGKAYCIAGDIISAKCHVPHMYRFELLGTPQDAERVREGLEKFWQQPR